MTNLEYIVEKYRLDTHNSLCDVAYYGEYGASCVGETKCSECPFGIGNEKEVIKLLLEEYKEKIPLKQWEYDLISIYLGGDYDSDAWDCLEKMKKIGHFKGVARIPFTVAEVKYTLDNNIIVEDDYDFGGEKND